MNINDIKQAFFIGIGGIGMSAIARFFRLQGVLVAGYDRSPSHITASLQKEGIQIVFSEEEILINEKFKNKDTTLVVYTPAISTSHRQLTYFRNNGYCLMKRSEILGTITEAYKAICIAGTHGKTTISTLTAHIFKQSSLGCTAFLGGISKNYKTNFLWDEKSDFVVVEADEFDRSFLTLKPHTELISAVDADHLDIYGSKKKLLKAFCSFAECINPKGSIVLKDGLPLKLNLDKKTYNFTYSISNKKNHFFGKNIRHKDNKCFFDLYTPFDNYLNLEMSILGQINVENAVGASALALLNGVNEDEIRQALATFTGIERRFDIHINTPNLIYIDDYAHHPEEIKATLKSVREMYPDFKVQIIFQPHLFTRTKDFYKEFANSLSMADELILTNIYPAREEPIKGITSEIIGHRIKNIPVHYFPKSEIADNISVNNKQIIITMGAGDIDSEVNSIKEKLLKYVDK